MWAMDAISNPLSTLQEVLSALCDTIYTTTLLSQNSLVSSLKALKLQESRFSQELLGEEFIFRLSKKEQLIIKDARRNNRYSENDIEHSFYLNGRDEGIVALILYFRKSEIIQKAWRTIHKDFRPWLIRRVVGMIDRKIMEGVVGNIEEEGTFY